MQPKIIMKNTEKKQTMISLSLAGAIGYYLYNKLVKAGIAPAINEGNADERTREELSWRPESVVEEPVYVEAVEEPVYVAPAEIPYEEPVVEEAVEEIVEEVVEEPVEAPVEEVVEEAVAEVETVVEEEAEIETVLCGACGAANSADDEVCAFCGTSLKPVEENVDPIAPEFPTLDFAALNLDAAEEIAEIVEDTVIETPVFEPIEEPVAEPVAEPVEEEVRDISDDDEDTTVEDLFDAVNDEKPADALMDNVEPLHKVDGKDASAKEEFKSIMDFFNTL